jgi:hypothetical protein
VLLDAGTGLTNYIWNNGLSTGSQLAVTSPGTYTVQATGPSGNLVTGSIVVTFIPPPSINIGNDTTICPGDTLILGSGLSGYTFNWSTGETTGNIAVSPLHSTVYTVITGYVGISDCYSWDSIQVNIYDNILLTPIADTAVLLRQQPGLEYIR